MGRGETLAMSTRIPYLAVLATSILSILACKGEQPPSEMPTPASAPASAPSTQKGRTAEERNATDPDGVVRRGLALTDAKALTIREVFERADQLANLQIKVSGVAGSVCKAEGCWFMLQSDDGRKIRIVSKDHAFFVPSRVRGLEATVEGQLQVKTISENEKELTLFAQGLEMKTPSEG